MTVNNPRDVNSDCSRQSTPKYVRGGNQQIKAATDPITKQIERFRDSMKEFLQVPLKRTEETSHSIQGSSRAPALGLANRHLKTKFATFVFFS